MPKECGNLFLTLAGLQARPTLSQVSVPDVWVVFRRLAGGARFHKGARLHTGGEDQDSGLCTGCGLGHL